MMLRLFHWVCDKLNIHDDRCLVLSSLFDLMWLFIVVQIIYGWIFHG